MSPLSPAAPTLFARLVCGLACCLALIGCEDAPPDPAVAGDAARGRELLWQYGCGSCHRIQGVVGAVGEVGPPLDGVAERIYVAGVLTNTPENLARWIRAPQDISPQTAMPNMGVTETQARDMVAYLHSKR